MAETIVELRNPDVQKEGVTIGNDGTVYIKQKWAGREVNVFAELVDDQEGDGDG